METKHFRCPGMIKKLSDCKVANISNLKNKIIFFTLLQYLSELKGSSVQCLISQLGHSFSLCLQRTLRAEKSRESGRKKRWTGMGGGRTGN